MNPTRKGTPEADMTKVYYSLYDRLPSPESLHRAFRKVKSNHGKPGIDGKTVEDFAKDLTAEIVILVSELRDTMTTLPMLLRQRQTILSMPWPCSCAAK